MRGGGLPTQQALRPREGDAGENRQERMGDTHLLEGKGKN